MSPRLAAMLATLLLHAGMAHAQLASCSSDGQPVPAAVLERFINADCADCWQAADAPQPRAGELVLDWIVPGSRGEDAPLSAAALRDGAHRLVSLRQPVPAAVHSQRTRPEPGPRVRVAHGLPLGGYVGTSLELARPGTGAWTAWLLLVETLPPGTEGSQVERRLVRNALRLDWPAPAPGAPPAPRRDLRPMNLPEGVRMERLSLVGWVEDARGRMRGIAQARCAPEGGQR